MTLDVHAHFAVILIVCDRGEELGQNLCLDDEIRQDGIRLCLSLAVSEACDGLEVLAGVNHEEPGLISHHIKVVVTSLDLKCLVFRDVGAHHVLDLVRELWALVYLIVDEGAVLGLVVPGVCFVQAMLCMVVRVADSHLDPHRGDVLLHFLLRKGISVE